MLDSRGKDALIERASLNITQKNRTMQQLFCEKRERGWREG